MHSRSSYVCFGGGGGRVDGITDIGTTAVLGKQSKFELPSSYYWL